MIRMIVNSDDYGRSAGISAGIREAHLQGVVSSTTCMMNFPTTADDVRAALQETPRLGLGVHLVLTSGRPILPPEKIPSLVGPDGELHKLAPFMEKLHDLNPREVQAEWRAQIGAFMAAAGRRPTHLDSHHHSSFFTEPLFRAMLELARELNCAIRLPTRDPFTGELDGLPAEVAADFLRFAPPLLAEFQPRTADVFVGSFYDETATREEIHRVLAGLQDGVVYEFMCHPGYADEALAASTIYNYRRNTEREVLTDPAIVQAFRDRGVQLINFGDL